MVSIIIPTYNCAKYILEAINSVLNQTYQNLEIIIINDGSTDNTQELVQSYINNFNEKIKYIYQENNGHAVARNVGILNSNGEYIAFLDADDIWLPNRLEEGVKILDNCPDIALVHARTIRVSEEGKPVINLVRNKNFLSGNIFENLFLRKAHISSPTVLVRRECFRQLGLFDENLARFGSEDKELWLRITKNYYVDYLDKVLAYYRVRENSQSKNIQKMMQGRLYGLNKICNKYNLSIWLKIKGYSNAYKEYGDSFLFNAYFGLATKQYIKSILYYPFNLFAFLNLFKALLKVKVKHVS